MSKTGIHRLLKTPVPVPFSVSVIARVTLMERPPQSFPRPFIEETTLWTILSAVSLFPYPVPSCEIRAFVLQSVLPPLSLVRCDPHMTFNDPSYFQDFRVSQVNVLQNFIPLNQKRTRTTGKTENRAMSFTCPQLHYRYRFDREISGIIVQHHLTSSLRRRPNVSFSFVSVKAMRGTLVVLSSRVSPRSLGSSDFTTVRSRTSRNETRGDVN